MFVSFCFKTCRSSFGNISDSESSKKSKFQIELEKFSKEPVKNVNPIAFWSQNKENYPALFYCFEFIFSIMASSVPSESLFSEAGDQVTDKRNRLDPDKVNKMMVVEDFFKFDKINKPNN